MKWVAKTLFIYSLMLSSLLFASDDEKMHQIRMEIKIDCPMSEELQAFVKSIPREEPGQVDSDFTVWKNSFVNNMNKLIDLVESEKVCNSTWSVDTDVYLP